MPAGEPCESLKSTYELQAGCADRRGVCRQEMKAFMNGRQDVLTEDRCADRPDSRLLCRQEMDVPIGGGCAGRGHEN